MQTFTYVTFICYYLVQSDYFEYLEQICMEHGKILNEKDPELRTLFNLLSNEEPILKKSRLAEIIEEFELPFEIEEFFIPIGRKEDLAFIDFCSLFKSTNPKNDMFFRTFASSFMNASSHVEETGDMFPIQIKPK
jgi:hypothetical protein